MDFTNSWKVLLFIAIALFGASMAANYKVGDDLGWSAAGTINYNLWADGKNFQVGDELAFKYNHQHIVMEVTSQDFESCNSNSPILTYTTGHDSVKLTSSGHHYYICDTPGHCEAGQKVHIIVRGHDDSSGPSVSPPDHNRASKSNISFMWLISTMLGMSLVVAYTF